MNALYEVSYIYAFGMENGPTKVGRSSFPEERCKQIEAKERQRVFIFGTWPVGAQIAFAVERYIHWLLREKHFRGEWFNASLDEVSGAISQALRSGVHPDYMIPSLEPVGKKRTYAEHVAARFVRGTSDDIEAVLGPGETQADFIRCAVSNEIGRRRASGSAPSDFGRLNAHLE